MRNFRFEVQIDALHHKILAWRPWFTIESKCLFILVPLLEHIFDGINRTDDAVGNRNFKESEGVEAKTWDGHYNFPKFCEPNLSPDFFSHPDITDIWCQIFLKIVPSFSLSNLSKPKLCWSNPTFLKPSGVTVFEAQISVTCFASLVLHGRLRWHNRRPEVGKLSSDRGPGHWILGAVRIIYSISIVYL